MKAVSQCAVSMVLMALTFNGSAAETESAKTWPSWRGAQSSGSAVSGNYAVDLTDDSAIKWKVELPGKGCSTPIVWNEHILVTSPIADQDALIDYDWDGQVRWQTKIGPQRKGKHRNGSGSNPSAVSDGKHIFVYFKSGNLAGLNFDGDLLWKTNLQDRFSKDSLYWDLGTSPVLTDEFVVVAVMHQGESYLAAFEKETGELAWRVLRNYETPVEGDHSYATPIVVEDSAGQTIVVWGAEHLTGHSAADGKMLWSCGGFNPEQKGNWVAVSSAVIVEGIAIVPYGRGSHLAGVKLHGTGDVTETHRLWTRTDTGSFVPTPAVHDGKVYVVGDKGEVECIDPESGQTLWSGNFPKNRNKYYASPTIADGKIYAPREDGVVMVAGVTDGFQLLAENDMGERVIASPVPVGGKMLIRGEKHLFCIAQSPASAGTDAENAPAKKPSQLASDSDGKPPIPNKEDYADAMARVKEVYQREYEQATSAEQKVALAKELLTAVPDPGIDANARYALLNAARMMAVQAGDADTAMRAIETMDQQFDIDVLVAKQTALRALAKTTKSKAERAELAKRFSAIAEEAAKQDRYDIAVRLLQVAHDLALRSRQLPLAREVASRLQEIERMASQFAEAQLALQILETDEADEEANSIVGQYYCFARGDWNRGLPLLAKSGNNKFQAPAERDSSGATTGAQQLELGDMWWALAQHEEGEVAQQLLTRARHWYLVALPNVTGLAKMKCEKRLGDAAQAMNSAMARQAKSSVKESPGLEFDGRAWLETELKYDGKTPLTIEVWATPAAEHPQSIVANCHGVGLALQVQADGHWGFYVRDKTTYQGAMSDEKVQLGRRTHVAGVFDGRIIRLFVNGRLQDDTGTMTSGHKVSNFKFMVGADPDFHSRPQQHFQGRIDSVHVSNAVIYENDFTPADPPQRNPSTVLLLQLDEGEGDVAKDSSVHQRHVRVRGAKWN